MAADDTLLVSTEEMVNAVNIFNTQKSAQMTAYESMKSTVAEMAGSWLGEASQNFQSQFQSFYSNIAQSEARMQDAVTEMEKAVDIFSAVESEHKGNFAAMDTGRGPWS
jgi:WXG100 family type VII secretion target